MTAVWAVRIVAALLAVVATCAGLAQLVPWADVSQSPVAVINEIRGHRMEPEHSLSPPPLRVLVSAISLDPVEHRVNATVAVVPALERPVFVDGSNQPVEDPRTGRLRDEFANLTVDIVLENRWNGETVVSYPFEKVVSFSAPGTIPNERRAVNAAIPADVDPQSFPNDSYRLDLYVTIALPRSVSMVSRNELVNLQQGHERRYAEAGSVPVVFGFAMEDRLTGWDLDTDKAVAGAPALYDESGRMAVVFTRSWSYWTFVYAISLMPAIIGFGFYAQTRRLRTTSGVGTSAAMELAAALIALLALRQVFVPSDISGLTRLDLLLGIQLLFVCWLLAARYVREPAQSPDTEHGDDKPRKAIRPRTKLRGVPPQPPAGARPRGVRGPDVGLASRR